jgi:peptidoglycan/xylan/chitin deacetylase (PgdA/CDA1 family)
MDLKSSSQQHYFLNTRKVIPQMLEIFKENELHVTWATVGMLMNENIDEWEKNKPALLPTYQKEGVSAYGWIDKHGFSNYKDVFHFAPDLVDKIIATPFQEFATHTYGHYYCLEEGQTPDQFKSDLEKACKLANNKGVQIRSLVFPRNQFNQLYLKICADLGITSVRSSPDIWYWEPATSSTIWKRIFRGADAYFKIQSIQPIAFKDLLKRENLPLLLPASRLYRPWSPKIKVLNYFKMKRILNEMTFAAVHGGYYHLWWHPHNFGFHPDECINELKTIAAHYHFLKNKHGFQSLSMQETVSKIINGES